MPAAWRGQSHFETPLPEMKSLSGPGKLRPNQPTSGFPPRLYKTEQRSLLAFFKMPHWTARQNDIGRSGRVGRYSSSRRPSCFHQQKWFGISLHDSERRFAPAPRKILRSAILNVYSVFDVLFLPRQGTPGLLAFLLLPLCRARHSDPWRSARLLRGAISPELGRSGEQSPSGLGGLPCGNSARSFFSSANHRRRDAGSRSSPYAPVDALEFHTCFLVTATT